MKKKGMFLVTAVLLGITLLLSAPISTLAVDREWQDVKKPIVGVYNAPYKNHAAWFGLNPYFKKIEEDSGGMLKLKEYPGGSLYTGAAILKGLKEGGVDASIMIPTFHPAELPRTNVLSDCILKMQETVASAGAVAEVLNVYKEFFEEEWKQNNIYMFGTYAMTPYYLFSKKSINGLADLKGFKTAFGTAAQMGLVTSLGMITVQMNPLEAYEGISRGIVDGNIGALAWLKMFNYKDVCSYAVKMPLGLFCYSVPIAFNRTWFDSLPKIAQKTLIKNYPILVSRISIEGFIEDEKPIVEAAVKEKGFKILETPTDCKPPLDKYFATYDKSIIELGIKNRNLDSKKVTEIVNTYMTLTDKWDKLSDNTIKDNKDAFEKKLYQDVYAPLLKKMGLE